MFNILFLGDVVGFRSCEFLAAQLPKLKRNMGVDFCVANGENSADGDGITPKSVQMLFGAGVDVITGGNHTFRRREVYGLLDSEPYLLRPANYSASAPGKGLCVYDKGSFAVAVINLAGTAFMDNGCTANAFVAADGLLSELDANAKIIIVDFHAEATAEKRALGCYLDGRTTLVAGTHTHIQTADECILPDKTAYITDAGACAPLDSVLGVRKEQAIERFTAGLPVRFTVADGARTICGVFVEADEKTGNAVSVERVNITE